MQVRMGWWKTNHRASQSRTLRSGDRTGKGGRNLFVWCLQSHLDCRECLNEFLVERKVWVMVQSIDCLLPVLATIPVTCDRLFQRFILLHPTSCWRFPLIAPHIDKTSSKTNGEPYSSPFIHVFIDSAAIVLLLLILTFLFPSSPISSTYAVLDAKVQMLSLQTIHLKQNSTNYRTNQTTNCENTSTKRCILRAGWSSLFLLLSLSPPPCFCRVFLLIRLCFYY